MKLPRVVVVVRTSEIFRMARQILTRFRKACLLALAIAGGLCCAITAIIVSARQ